MSVFSEDLFSVFEEDDTEKKRKLKRPGKEEDKVDDDEIIERTKKSKLDLNELEGEAIDKGEKLKEEQKNEKYIESLEMCLVITTTYTD